MDNSEKSLSSKLGHGGQAVLFKFVTFENFYNLLLILRHCNNLKGANPKKIGNGGQAALFKLCKFVSFSEV